MDSRKAGGLFLTQTLVSIGGSLWLSFGNPGFDLDIIPNLMVSQMMLLLPALLFLVVVRENPAKVMNFRPVKFTTCLWIFLFTFLMTPLIVTVNAFSMIFSDNAVMGISNEVLAQPFLVMVMLMGIFGPFSEEFVFRGVIFGGLRKSGRILPAILLQAFLFGLMHMNFNQFCYAFVIGIALGVLVEVTGSIWSGFVMHAAINTSNVVMLYVSSSLTDQMEAALDESYTSDMMVVAMCVYMVIALATTSIAACVLVAIAKNENGMDRLRNIFTTQKRKESGSAVLLEPVRRESLLSAPTVIAVILCCAFMIALEVVKRMIPS